MTEVELKAHVLNPDALLKKLSEFAVYEKSVTRNDCYYRLYFSDLQKQDKKYISVRLRKEIQIFDSKKADYADYADFTDSVNSKNCENSENATKKTEKILLTYKKKEQKIDSNGNAVEVNEEHETEVQDENVIKTILIDSGYVSSLKKFKEVKDFSYSTPFGKATIEVCFLPELGTFVEIEILTQDNSEENILKIQEELKNILSLCEIPKSQIENRYYSELLEEVRNKEKAKGKNSGF